MNNQGVCLKVLCILDETTASYNKNLLVAYAGSLSPHFHSDSGTSFVTQLRLRRIIRRCLGVLP